MSQNSLMEQQRMPHFYGLSYRRMVDTKLPLYKAVLKIYTARTFSIFARFHEQCFYFKRLPKNRFRAMQHFQKELIWEWKFGKHQTLFCAGSTQRLSSKCIKNCTIASTNIICKVPNRYIKWVCVSFENVFMWSKIYYCLEF